MRAKDVAEDAGTDPVVYPDIRTADRVRTDLFTHGGFDHVNSSTDRGIRHVRRESPTRVVEAPAKMETGPAGIVFRAHLPGFAWDPACQT